MGQVQLDGVGEELVTKAASRAATDHADHMRAVGQDDLYDDEDDGDYRNVSFDAAARQELEDGSSSDSDGAGPRKKKLDTSQEKIEVNLDDIEDDDDQECLLDYKQSDLNKLSKNKMEPVKQKSSNDST